MTAQTAHQTSGGRRSSQGKQEGNGASRAQPARGLPKAPREEGAVRKHRLAEVVKVAGRLCPQRPDACCRSPRFFNQHAFSISAHLVPRPQTQPQLEQSAKPGL